LVGELHQAPLQLNIEKSRGKRGPGEAVDDEVLWGGTQRNYVGLPWSPEWSDEGLERCAEPRISSEQKKQTPAHGVSSNEVWWGSGRRHAHTHFGIGLGRRSREVSYLYFPKGGRIYIMSKTNIKSNFNEYY
jgi:hypothetical protein